MPRRDCPWVAAVHGAMAVRSGVRLGGKATITSFPRGALGPELVLGSRPLIDWAVSYSVPLVVDCMETMSNERRK